QLNVAGRWFAVDLGDHIVRAQPRRGGRAAWRHRLDIEPVWQPGLFRRCWRYRYRLQPEVGVGHPARGDDLVGDGLGEINWYGKSQPDAAPTRVRHGRTGRRHPYQLALAVDQGAAAVAGIDGGIGLDRGHQQRRPVVVAGDLHGPVQGAD